MSFLRLAAALAAVSFVASCGAQEKSKDKQAEEFYAEKLHTDDQKACNQQGHLYDALDAQCKTDVALAKWACTRDGLAAHLAERGDLASDKVTLAGLDEQLKDGYELHQFGEGADQSVYVVIVKKGRNDDEATLEVRHLLFDAPEPAPGKNTSLRFSLDVYAPLGVGECQHQVIEHMGTVGTGGDAKLDLVPVEKDVSFKVTYDEPKLQTYSDAACTKETFFFTIAKGEKSVPIYYAFSAKGSAALGCEASGFDSVASQLVATAGANDPEPAPSAL